MADDPPRPRFNKPTELRGGWPSDEPSSWKEQKKDGLPAVSYVPPPTQPEE